MDAAYSALMSSTQLVGEIPQTSTPKSERGNGERKEEGQVINSWESLQRGMKIGSRGLGRGLALVDWNTLAEQYIKAASHA